MESSPASKPPTTAAAAAGPAAEGAKTVAVLGAGVQGLTAALLLRLQGHAVTVVARGSPDDLTAHAPPDRAAAKAAAGSTPADPTFTSPKAGANWQSFADKDDVRQQRWDEATFYTLHRLGYHAPSGVMHLPAFQYFPEPPAGFEDPWFARIVPGYGPVPADQLPPGCRFGIGFDTVTLNVPKYLCWLAALCRQRGVAIVHRDLAHIADVLSVVKKADIVVNCSGYGAKTLGGVMDANIYPIRGQTVLVRAPQVKRTIGTALSSGSYRSTKPDREEANKVTYVIPREDGIVILGGTYQADNPSLEIDPQTAQGIMERCVAVCPELVVNGKLPEIVQHSVGLRPARKGGVRMEANYEKFNGREVLVVHNYGHGGFGFQSSWGCASNVVGIVRRALGQPADDKILTNFLNEIYSSKL
ncbi:hypothetical protein HK405_003938 [Cladochytrium tenue]|nr:hypothetical protein HK405_003938 [Cladochytrium tenue]